ncbi:glycosyltransferase [Paenibacillus sp. NPDC058071]|uniref:tetratricopeptide repeat-containing glycosyltransferase family 2 protein n=1 Tax=Paenibacillus sp. NPDC058071 TaxID=3346326 RepID=UPI0036DDC96F
MKISVCFIVKNEEKTLMRALNSIPDDYDVVVVDTGSNDRTVEIAQQRQGVRIFHFDWSDHFAEARNASIQYAIGDYIFVMDADEELPLDWEASVKRHLTNYPNSVSTVCIRNITEGELTAHHMARLFPNDSRYSYVGRVHEQLYVDGQLAVPVRSDITIDHYGYANEQFQLKQKFNRYLELYEKELNENPNDGYVLYQLGKLYYSTKQYKEAYIPLVNAVELQQFDRLYYPPLLIALGYTLKELNQSREAFDLLEPLLELYPQFPDLAFLLGSLAMDNGDIEKIELYFKAALSIGETNRYTTVVGCGSYRAAHNLGVFYEVFGKAHEAEKYYQIAARENFEPSLLRLKELSTKS